MKRSDLVSCKKCETAHLPTETEEKEIAHIVAKRNRQKGEGKTERAKLTSQENRCRWPLVTFHFGCNSLNVLKASSEIVKLDILGSKRTDKQRLN